MSRSIPRLPVVQRESYLLDHVPQSGRILHVGCTAWPATAGELADGRLLHARLVAKGDVTGIDIAEPGLALLREAGFEDVHKWDALDLSNFPQKGYDCVVASDVIEHVSNPGRFLEGVAAVLKPDGVLLLSTANAFSFEILAKLPLNWEGVNPEHVCYFSYGTLVELITRFGFASQDAAYYHELGWRGPFDSIAHFAGYAMMRVASFAVPHYSSGLVFTLRTA